jgi:hypothetical protein
MAEINWADHTLAEVRRALDTAPKVAGPWQRASGMHTFDGEERWIRLPREWVNGRFVGIADVVSFGPGKRTIITYGHVIGDDDASSLEDGKAKADAALRAAGWLLDDEEG